MAWIPLLYLLVLFLLPTGLVVCYSFLERDYAGQVNWVWSLESWGQTTDAISLSILVRSVSLALGITLACLLLGYPCALVMSRLPVHWRQICVVLISFPLVTSLLLRIYGWMNLLPLEWRGTAWTVGLVMTVNYLPFMVLPLLRSCERADVNLVHAALDLGANPWQTFWHVTWPLTRPGMWAGSALVFIPSAGEYLVPHFIGEGKVRVLGTLIVQEFMERRNWPYAAATAIWLLALVTLPAVLLAWRSARHDDSSTRRARHV